MERRWSTRKNLYLNVDLQVPSHTKKVVPATLLDISRGGAFIATQVSLPTRSALTIKLKLPGNFIRNGFRLNAITVHNTSRGVGVSFVGVQAGVINALIEALTRHKEKSIPVKPAAWPGFIMNKARARLLLTMRLWE